MVRAYAVRDRTISLGSNATDGTEDHLVPSVAHIPQAGTSPGPA